MLGATGGGGGGGWGRATSDGRAARIRRRGACGFAWIGCLCERLCHPGRGLQGHQHASTSTAIAPAAAVLPPSGKDLKNLDADFVKQATLFDLIVGDSF
uniref:Uncharacterized protein n=1 Tax=Oryza glaberrima TaxID=4538 RepID=I1QTT1_ORYGL